jgi:hypothetical protein
MRFTTHLSYDPGLDRLVGGDYLREVDARPTKSLLLPLSEAKRQWAAMMQFGARYTAEHGPPTSTFDPYPVPLALFELKEFSIEARDRSAVPIAELLMANALTIVPSGYRELTHMVTGVPSMRTVERWTPSEAELPGFASQLFQILRCVHESGHALNRNGGTCIREQYLTPEGGLNDFYFLALGGNIDAAGVRDRQQSDIRDPMRVVLRLGKDDKSAANSAGEALAVYTLDPSIRYVAAEFDRLRACTKPKRFAVFSRIAAKVVASRR